MHGVCAVTGTSGYIGPRIARRLTNAGWEVRALGRPRSGQKQFEPTEARFELGDQIAPQTLAGADALVHLAYDFSLSRWADIERVNVEGSKRLFAAAQEAGVDRIVYLSSIAAFPGARSMYGRAKLACEQTGLSAGAAIVRPGLVWGPDGAAMFGALRHAVERAPLVPLPVPERLRLHLAHEDDLAALVEGILARWPAGAGRVYVAASAETLEFGELLRSLALQAGRHPRFVRLPWRIVRDALRLLEAIGARPPFRSDSLLSLVACDEQPLARATDGAGRYGVSFRPCRLA
jgi:nucleoside-diphosphate-sugar epimerase